MNSVGVLLSGAGSNLNAMINNGIDVKFVVSNKQHAYGLDIAEEANIPIYCWQSLKELEEQVSKLVIQYEVTSTCRVYEIIKQAICAINAK
jgi:folate-dependent phosphoribosylglycinamide formyltransferase PurN